MTEQPYFDAAVIGGGPAGAVTAVRLKELGMAVILIARARPKGALEGLAPRMVETLKSLGFGRAAALSAGPAMRRVRWNGADSAANSEALVERSDFDWALLTCADEAGVTLIKGSAMRMVRQESGWRIDARGESGDAHVIRARMIVDARGRRALPRRLSRLNGPATFSLARWYEGAEIGESFTAIASHKDGWSWLASLGDGRVCIQALTGFEKKRAHSRDYLTALHESIMGDAGKQFRVALGKRLSSTGNLIVRDARVSLSREPASQYIIRVGDAAASVDPLSGHGIFQAISSGLAAVPTLNTILNRPDQAQLAIDFYQSRVTRRFHHQVLAGQEFYGEEKQWADSPFWRERRDWLRPEKTKEIQGLSLCRKAVVENGFVAEREVLITPAHVDGVLLLEGVPMADLWRETQTGGARLPETQLAQKFGVTSRQIGAALRWLREQSGKA